MSQLADIVRFDPVSLQRFLRQEVIGWVVKGLKITFAVVALGSVSLVVYEAIRGTLAARTTISALQTAMSSIKLAETSQRAPRDKSAPYNMIAERNIFGPMTPPPSTLVQRPTGAQKPAVVTPFSLIGTFVAEGQAPYAIIEDQKKKIQDVFDLNTMVFGEAKLTAIFSDRVEIDRNGQKEILVLDDMLGARAETQGAVTPLENDEFIVDEAELDKALENLPLLLTQARAVPYFSDGQAVGLRLFAIKSGSLYEKIGLRNGDVLKSVNGSSLADLSQAMQLFERLKTERSISLTIERNREEKEFKYQIR